MTITAEQAATRKKFLGASDIGAILGVNPFRNAADVWVEKTQSVAPFDDTESIEIGNDFERPLLNWAERKIKRTLVFDLPTAYHPNGIMCANLDAAVMGDNLPVEAKCTAMSEEWGDEGTDIVPSSYLVQLTAQMMCCGVDRGYIAAFLGGFRMARRLYAIELNTELAEAINEQACEWWEKYVVGGVMPNAAPSIDVVKRIQPRPGTVVPVSVETARAFIAANEKAKEAEKEKEEAKARLLAELGGADGGECEGFDIAVKSVNVKEYTVQARTDRRLTCKAAK